MPAVSTPTTGGSQRTLVTIATYNEIENLPRLVDDVMNTVPGADVLIIDDNSPDGTGDWCDERAAKDPRLHCVHRVGKQGLGTAIIAGICYGIAQGYDYVLNMDADYSHDPRYIPDLIAGMHADGQPRRDVMIGSRYVPGGGIEGWPLTRHLMSRTVNLYARILLGLPCQDCSGAFRCYRTEMLRRLDLDSVRSRGYSFQEEILWLLKREGARFGEAPIIFKDREHGQSKIHAGEALSALWIILRLGVKNWLGVYSGNNAVDK